MTLREIEQGIGTGEVGRHCRSGWRGQAANLRRAPTAAVIITIRIRSYAAATASFRLTSMYRVPADRLSAPLRCDAAAEENSPHRHD